VADYICTVNPPVASFTWFPTTPATVDPEVTFTNLSLGNLINNWTINGQTNTEINPIYFMPSDIAETFDACLSVEGLYGCTDQVCYTVTVDREEFIFVPNSFTPDQDGINDVFMPVMSGIDEENPSYYLAIYNRWGDLIFETTDYKKAWTGNVHDGDYYAQDGVYLWVLKVKLSESDLTREMQGHVTLVR
jgi:gliding motility-associated-like protein